MNSNVKPEQAAAFADYLQMQTDGSIGLLDGSQALELAKAVSNDPVVHGVVVGSAYAARSAMEIDDVIREAQANEARMRFARRSAMYAHSNVSDDEAGRIELDAQLGDPSLLAKLKERFYFE